MDAKGEYSINEVSSPSSLLKFSSSTDENLEFGLTDSFVWLRFRVKNDSDITDWILEFNIHKFYTVEIYSSQGGEAISLEKAFCYTQPFAQREIQEANLAFSQEIMPGAEKIFYIKIKSENSLVIPLILHSKENYLKKMNHMQNLWSAFYGILVVMFLYNILIYFFLRDRNYLYYVVYVFVYSIYLSALSGIGAKYIWPFVEGRWTTVFSAIFGGLSLAVGCYLTREFLQTRRRNPRLDKMLIVLAFFGAVLSMVNIIFEKFMIAFIYGNVIGTIILLASVVISIISLVKGYKPALYFLFSYITVIAGQLFYSLISLGTFKDYLFLKNINQFAPVFQVVLLSLSLAYRFNIMRMEKDQAQAVALEAEAKLSENLEDKVQERTRELESANIKLELLSNIDGLTGLYNRRYFDDIIKSEWKRLRRGKLSLSLIMCDIDYFKKFNDTAGHQAGDDCLCKISSTIKSAARRASDITARYGGEEFVVVLPQMDSVGAKKVAKLIAKKINSLGLSHPAFPDRTVTLSIGVATMFPSLGGNPERIIAAADQGLYTSKKKGRNKITVINPEIV